MLDLSHGILGARSCGISDIEASPENSLIYKFMFGSAPSGARWETLRLSAANLAFNW